LRRLLLFEVMDMAEIARRRSTGIVAFLLAALSVPLLTAPGAAQQALPQNPTVISGGVSIGPPSGSSLTITQTTPRAIVNWQSFSIGQPNTVTFNQPGATAAILNRVTGTTTSTIAGQLNANGQVFLVNPNGIVITPTGTVKAGGGFVASTLDIANEDFLSGELTFAGSGASAGVSNAGTISTDPGGFVALLGGSVANSGTISVPLGRVGLGSGERATLDLYGDGFLQVAVPTGSEAEGALVEQSGRISANGGRVELKAATVREAIREAVNMSGVVAARSVSGRNGAIVLGGGAGGKVRVTGKLDAGGKKGAGRIAVSGRDVTVDGGASLTARSSEGKGGEIALTADDKLTVDQTQIDASGHSGGGKVLLGGDYQGGGTLAHAKETVIGAGAAIRADATGDGSGGTVVVWSDERTSFEGVISAKGAGSGAGGLAEVSSAGLLRFTGRADLSAAQGAFGTLLLDPYDIVIKDADDFNHDGFTATGPSSVIDVAALVAQLASSNVTVSTGNGGGSEAGNITVAAPVTWSANTTLTLEAANDIFINSAITATGTEAGLTLDTANGIFINAPITFTGENASLAFKHGSAGYHLLTGVPVTLAGDNATFSVNGQAYTLIRNADQLQDMQLDLAGHYALAVDIDASETAGWNAEAGFDPVGDDGSLFIGTFDGLGHTITGLTINRPFEQYVGLFGYTDGAMIRHLGLVGGSVTGNLYVGGLVGYNYRGTIETSYATGTVMSSGFSVGGLVGVNEGGTIETSYAPGNLMSSGYYVGGLVGTNLAGGTIARSYATGSVTGSYFVGGLVGLNSGEIATSYATGAVTGRSDVGGLVGWNWGGTIEKSYATGTVMSSGDPLDDYSVGGLVGWNDGGTISTTYATGAVTGSGNVGGLVGYNGGAVERSYWDTESSGTTLGIGGDDGSANGVAGRTTDEMQDITRFAETYEGWDFETVWSPPNQAGQGGDNTAHYPELYALSRVVAVQADAEITYGESRPDFGTVPYGGFDAASGKTLYALASESIDPDAIAQNIMLSASGISQSTSNFDNAGDYALDAKAGDDPSVDSTGEPYRVVVVPGTYRVNKKELTVTASAQDKEYDGTTTASVTLGHNGVAGDALTLSFASAAFADKTVGAGKQVTVSGITLGGADAENYTFDTTQLFASASITPAELVITAHDLRKLYGEELTFTGSEYTVAGLIAGDEVTAVTLTSAGAAATAPVGYYSIVPSDPQGIGLQNYNFTFVNGLLTVDGVFLTLPSQLVPSRLLMSSGTEVTLASSVLPSWPPR
jgi:filamentous hemagglutinin family protein